MRSFFVGLFLALFLILFLPVHVILWLIGKKNPRLRYAIGQKLIYFAFWCELSISGVKLTVIGKENIPDTPVLFVSNHQSYFDILVTHNSAKRPMGFVAKKEMEKYPLLPLYMRDIGCIFLNRTDPREGVKTIQEGARRIEAGHSMLICPEGTRSKCDDMNEFKEGSLKMAEKAKVPVVPVAIIGTNRLLECRPGFKIRKGKVTVVYGSPFMLSELPPEYKRKPAAYTQNIIRNLMAEAAETPMERS